MRQSYYRLLRVSIAAAAAAAGIVAGDFGRGRWHSLLDRRATTATAADVILLDHQTRQRRVGRRPRRRPGRHDKRRSCFSLSLRDESLQQAQEEIRGDGDEGRSQDGDHPSTARSPERQTDC